MNLLKSIDQLSFWKVISIAAVLAVLVSVPVGVVLVQQDTRISSRAAYEKPKLATQPKATSGPVPSQAPHIGRVYPWVGKVGDVVWVQGKNFGSNPSPKQLTVGTQSVPDEQIEAWDDTLIQTVIPESAKQGGMVEVQVGDHPKSQSLPYVLYDATTKTRLHKEGTQIFVEDAETVVKGIIWTGDDVIPTEKHEVVIDTSGDTVFLFDTQHEPLLSIILLDQNGKIVPYYVNPIEFGF